MCLAAIDANAQNEAVKGADSSGRRYNHYIGLQLNELIRQVFNYDKTADGNPYQLTYSLTSVKNKWNLRSGIGANFSNQTNIGTYIDTTIKSLSVQVRVGAERSFKLYKRFVGGIGLDIVYDYRKEENIQKESQLNAPTSNDELDNTTTRELFGGGPELSLKYQFSNRIAVGTELELYYLNGTKENKIIDKNFATDRSKSISIKQSTINTPVVFYLIIKL